MLVLALKNRNEFRLGFIICAKLMPDTVKKQVYNVKGNIYSGQYNWHIYLTYVN